MKNIVIKSSLIGLVVGFIMSFNMMFIGIGGQFVYFVSLGFILDLLPFSEAMGWIGGFIFIILVYVLYGAIVGFLITRSKNNKRGA